MKKQEAEQRHLNGDQWESLVDHAPEVVVAAQTLATLWNLAWDQLDALETDSGPRATVLRELAHHVLDLLEPTIVQHVKSATYSSSRRMI